MTLEHYSTVQLLRTAASILDASTHEADRQLAGELRVRSQRIHEFREEAERDRRRGFFLPLEWLLRLDGASAQRPPWESPQPANDTVTT